MINKEEKKIKKKKDKTPFRFGNVLAGLLFLLLGCAEKETWQPGMPLAGEGITIGFIYPNRIGDVSSYDYAHYMGSLEMQRALRLTDGRIIRKFDVFDGDSVEAEAAMRDCIARGAKVIVAASWGYMDACEKLAVEFPRVVFLHATGHKNNGTNFTNYSGRLYHGRYLSGIAAGLKTAAGKIGYVAAMGKDNSEVTGGINAFALGVESVNPSARIYLSITWNWFDPAGEKLAAEKLIASGCDVIAQHCNTSAPQIAAQNAGVWGIGFNSDMKNDAPDAVIASVVVNWGVFYTRMLESVIDGTFSAVPYFYGLKEGVVDITGLDENLAAPGTAEALEAARRRIHEGFNVFDGVMETNDGRFVGAEGQTLSDAEILGGIDWYYRTVVEP